MTIKLIILFFFEIDSENQFHLISSHRLTITSEQHSSVMQQALDSLRTEYERKMFERIEETRRKEKDSYDSLVGEERDKNEMERVKLTDKMNSELEEARKACHLLQKVLCM